MAVTLTIELQDTGQILVHGPIHDKILCFGLLQVAIQVVEHHEPKKVITPTLIPPSNLTGLPGGKGGRG